MSMPMSLAAVAAATALAVTGLAASDAIAQEYPTQTIRIVIPYAPGGGSDLLARPMAQDMSERLKQPIIIDNRPGAGGNIGAQQVARSTPDGYTLLMANNSHVINTFVYRNAGYDIANDFAPISVVATSPIIAVVHKSFPAQTLVEFIAHARKHPGKLNFGSSGTGTPGHMAPLLFNRLAGLDLVHVPYKGTGPATAAVLAREIDISFLTPAAVEPHIRSGELRALAVTSRERFAAFPDLPTIAESGIPALADYQMEIWWGLLAPAKTDPGVLDKLHAAMAAAVQDPKINQRWVRAGMVPRVTSRSEFQALIRADVQTWEKVVRDNKVAVD